MERLSPKKRVAVSFAGADDTGSHVLTEGRGKQKRSSKAGPIQSLSNTPKKRASFASDVLDNEAKENNCDEDEDEEQVFKPSSALAGEDDIFGNQVFGFKTPKKSGQMAQKASESALAMTPKTPKAVFSEQHTPKSGRKSQTQTPKSILKNRSSLLQETGKTPLNKRGSKRIKKMAAQTPHRMRSRVKEDSDSYSSEDSALSESEEDEDASSVHSNTETVTEREASASSSTVTGTPKRAKQTRVKKDKDETVKSDNVESYFDAQTMASVTSDRTLSKLETPRMDQEQLLEALEGVEVGYKTERGELYDDYRSQFNKWMYLLCNNYNLLFHGLGSKRKLLDEFRTDMLADFSHILINGYFPSLTIKSILNSITEDIIDHKGSFRSPLDQCDFIRQHYEKQDEDFYLVINNIEGPMLRPEKTQTVLSLLAQVPGFHIIASIDHINAPLIWDQTKASRFNWLWYDVTTYEPYVEETSYENSLLVQQSGVLALSSLTHVMRSLTPNAKGIFLLLVRYQMENKDNNFYQGLAFPDLYQKCREAFLVNSDLTLRTQLTEFKDHKLIRSKKGHDGVDYLTVPLDEATLKEFMEQQEDDS